MSYIFFTNENSLQILFGFFGSLLFVVLFPTRNKDAGHFFVVAAYNNCLQHLLARHKQFCLKLQTVTRSVDVEFCFMKIFFPIASYPIKTWKRRRGRKIMAIFNQMLRKVYFEYYLLQFKSTNTFPQIITSLN